MGFKIELNLILCGKCFACLYGCAPYAMPGAQGAQKRELDIPGTGVMEGLSHSLSARNQALVFSKTKCS